MVVISIDELRSFHRVELALLRWRYDFSDPRPFIEFVEEEFGVLCIYSESNIIFQSEQAYTMFLIKWS